MPLGFDNRRSGDTAGGFRAFGGGGRMGGRAVGIALVVLLVMALGGGHLAGLGSSSSTTSVPRAVREAAVGYRVAAADRNFSALCSLSSDYWRSRLGADDVGSCGSQLASSDVPKNKTLAQQVQIAKLSTDAAISSGTLSFPGNDAALSYPASSGEGRFCFRLVSVNGRWLVDSLTRC